MFRLSGHVSRAVVCQATEFGDDATEVGVVEVVTAGQRRPRVWPAEMAAFQGAEDEA